MAAMRPKHVAKNHLFVALNLLVLLLLCMMYIYIYILIMSHNVMASVKLTGWFGDVLDR